MTFDSWWATLTEAEQKTIGKHNARFVWQQACQAMRELMEKKDERKTD